MDPQAEAFLQYYAALKMSGATIGSYRQSLRFFSSFLEERGKTLCEATAADVNDFIAAHAEWTASTIANRQSALRSFYKWAQTQHMLSGDNPMLPIRSPRQHQVRNKPYVHEDEARLLRETRRTYRNGTSRAQDLRDRCLIALIYATGLRVAEVASLNVGHIRGMDPTHRSFIYRGKGGSEQTWYLNAEIYGMLTRYLRTLDTTNPGAPLFSNRYGKRLSIRSIQKILADRGAKSPGSAHSSSYASAWVWQRFLYRVRIRHPRHFSGAASRQHRHDAGLPRRGQRKPDANRGSDGRRRHAGSLGAARRKFQEPP